MGGDVLAGVLVYARARSVCARFVCALASGACGWCELTIGSAGVVTCGAVSMLELKVRVLKARHSSTRCTTRNRPRGAARGSKVGS